jgi:methionyl-tRNA formyltransferase
MDRPAELLLLMPPAAAAAARRQAVGLQGLPGLHEVPTLRQLQVAVASARRAVVLAFGTGVVVPPAVLAQPGITAFNIHAASPDYPGRDPHHFAAYDGVRTYGATLHVMTPAVDQGPIVKVLSFDVAAQTSPVALLQLANAASLDLVRWLFEQLAQGVLPLPDPTLRWTGTVRRRRDFVALCRVDATMSAEEFERRRRAAGMPGYTNLWTEVHGCRFLLAAPPRQDA